MLWRDATMPWEAHDDDGRESLRACWGGADLSYKLDASQEPIYHDIKASHGRFRASAERWYLLDIGRRWGKDFVMAVLAVEVCLAAMHAGRRPARVPYGAMSKESVRDILVPIMDHVISDAPPEWRPRFIEQRKEYRFPDGSFIKCVGCNQEPDSLRGPYATAVFLTECAFYRRLDYVWSSVVLPMMLTEESAFAVLGSSPPESPAHEWTTEFVPTAKAKGAYAHRTIDDNPRITEYQREAFIAELGGRGSTKCKRELFAEHVVEETLAIVPEFQAQKEHIIEAWEPPEFFEPMVSMDVGFNDFSVAALGYHDFAQDLAIVEDEVAMNRQRSDVLDRAVAEKELELWGDRPVRNRYADAAPIVLAELNRAVNDPKAWWNADPDVSERLREKVRRDRGRNWMPTRNDDLQAQVNALREKVGRRRYRVHPRCAVILAHMEHGVWKETSADEPRAFARSGKFGHFDGVAAVMYFERNLNRAKNPYPALAAGTTSDTHWLPPRGASGLSENAIALRQAFKPRRRQ